MLPFPKRKATNDVVELTDDDLVLVEEITPRVTAKQPSSPSPSSHSHVRAAATRAPHGSALPPGSRRVLDEQVEEDVAGQCLASIAAATSHESARHLSASSHIRAALAAAPVPAFRLEALPHLPPADSRPSTSRLPSVSAPPFVRTTTAPRTSYPLPGEAASPRAFAPEAPGIRDSSPPAAFIRRSSPALAYPVSSMTLPPTGPSQSSVGSVAPVSMSGSTQGTPEPTVILVRERPRSIWIVAAAAVGALGAIAAMRFAPAVNVERAPVAEPHAAAQPPSVPAPVLPLPSTAVVVPVASSAPPAAVAPVALAAAPVAPAASAGSPAVMRFAEDQGATIKAPVAAPRRPAAAASPAAAPAARPASPSPRVPSMGPALPDGSFGLGRSDTTTAAAAPAPPLTASAPVVIAPEPPRKRALTPEQQLAEAQLKASMR